MEDYSFMEEDMQVTPSAMSQAAAQPYTSQYVAPAQALAAPPEAAANETAEPANTASGGQNDYGGAVDVQA